VKRVLLAVALALPAGCIARHQRPQEPTREERLLEAVTRARVAASAGQHAEADAILGRFVNGNTASPEAREATYWRAILRLESATSQADRDAARRYLDSYLADTATTVHLSEARIIRRLLTIADSTSQATDSVSAAAREAASAREEALRKEVQSLKEQLEKTNEELERIKKRLGSRP
jgi:hypothetical protein